MIKMKLILLSSFIVVFHRVLGIDPRVDPLVRIEQGLVRGQLASDGAYASFLGIPYAEVDSDNPFGAALPYPHFDEIFNANDSSIKCPQTSRSGEYSEQILDCLRLNIYVPDKASSINPLPVMVWIHGGGFVFRSGGEFHPPNLIKHGVIVVTINYRLGPYGFMCLDVPSVPGNQGIRDQYDALRWVRNNIAAFGGNPYDVTLAGESAGSACVLYHLYSSQEKLFNKIIIQSDTPQNEGMFVEKDIDAALKLALYLGYNTNDTQQAIDFLAQISPNLIIGANEELNLRLKPCKEKSFDGVVNIIENDPLTLENKNKVARTPVLIGHTTREHLHVLLEMYGDDYLNQDPFYKKLKDNFNLDDQKLFEIASMVRHFYIGDEPLSEKVISVLEDFDSDFVFNHPVQRTISNLLVGNASPVHQYLFSYVGDSGAEGAAHASENNYLFDTSNVVRNDDDQLIVDRITILWTNFVKFGNPTPSATELLPVIWEPAATNTRPYLVIDTDMRLEHRVFQDRMSFWDLFYSVYGKHNIYLDV